MFLNIVASILGFRGAFLFKAQGLGCRVGCQGFGFLVKGLGATAQHSGLPLRAIRP